MYHQLARRTVSKNKYTMNTLIGMSGKRFVTKPVGMKIYE